MITLKCECKYKFNQNSTSANVQPYLGMCNRSLFHIKATPTTSKGELERLIKNVFPPSSTPKHHLISFALHWFDENQMVVQWCLNARGSWVRASWGQGLYVWNLHVFLMSWRVLSDHSNLPPQSENKQLGTGRLATLNCLHSTGRTNPVSSKCRQTTTPR